MNASDAGAGGRMLRIREVKTFTGLSATTIYRNIAAGTFPAPVRLSVRAVGWREADLQQWQSALQAPGADDECRRV